MQSGTNRLQLALATLLVLCVGAVIADGVAAKDQPEGELGNSCVLGVGDLNGDGIPDYAASNRTAGGSPVVHLIFGSSEPPPSTVDARYLAQHTALILRGPSAAPFICPDEATLLGAGRIRGAASHAAQRRREVAESPIDRPISYTIVDLDPLMPEYSLGFSSSATGINANGQIVGRFFAQQGDRAFFYDRGELRDLGTLGGQISDARDINDAGAIVGYSLTGETDASGFVNAAFVSHGYSMQDLGLRWSAANAINSAGQIVGELQVQPNLNHAFLYEEGSAIDLRSLLPVDDPGHSVALSINDAGQVVGESNTRVMGGRNVFSTVHAFLYEHGAMRDLGGLGMFCVPFLETERCIDRSTATDINNHGQTVGFSTTPSDGSTHAFATFGDGPRDLGTLGGSSSWAYGANDSGQIVGTSLNPDEQYAPFLYDRGTMYDLNTLILAPVGTAPFAAYAINNFGQIAGNHHLLNPVYDSVSPGRTLSFDAMLGKTFTFEYWAARGDATACHAPNRLGREAPNRLRLQVRIGAMAEAAWLPAATLTGCDDSADWGTASVTIPEELQNTAARIHLRLRESAPGTDPLVHLRHFGME